MSHFYNKDHIITAMYSYRRDIDGLRALAVLSVVGFHAFPEYFPGGYIGVDIFFVISGYLITGILLRDVQKNQFSIAHFYARRIRRIIPALLSILVVCLIAGWLVFLTDEYKTLGKNIVASSFFVSNFFLWTQVNYFDVTSEYKPLLHLWSLGVEEQFYIVWPILLYLLSKRKNLLLVGTLVIILMSFASALSNLNDSASRFYLPNNRFWELLIGALLSCGFQFEFKVSIPHAIKSFMGLALIVVSIFALDKHTTFPGWAALMPTLGAFLLISASEQTWINKKIFSNRLAVSIGLISYSFYLWHWPLLAFARVINGGEIPAYLRAACVAGGFVLAYLTYILIEKPLRTPRKWSISVLLVATVLVGEVGYLSAKNIIKPRSASHGLELILKEIDEWELPKAERTIQFENQNFPAQGNSKDVTLFIGDSNMGMYAPRINKIVAEDITHTGKGAVFATLGGCMPAPNVGRIDTPDCLPLMRAAFRYALDTSSVSTVVVAALWSHYHYDNHYFYQEGTEQPGPVLQQEGKVYDRFEKTLHDLVTSGKKVYIVLSIPWNEHLDPRKLFKRSSVDFQFNVANSTGIKKTDLSNIEDTNNRLVAIAQRTGAHVINPVDHLCGLVTCPLFTENGQMIYKDADHLTVRYVVNYASYIDEAMK